MSDRRLFFALWPEKEALTSLTEMQQKFLGCGRLVAPQNLHLTLSFLGAVPPSRFEQIFTLGDRFQGASFDLSLGQFGYWKKPQVLWLGVEHTPQPLSDLVAWLERELAGVGFAKESRPYRPHLTLLRKVSKRPHFPEFSPISWSVHEFRLMHSTLSSQGAHYQTLRSWGLKG